MGRQSHADAWSLLPCCTTVSLNCLIRASNKGLLIRVILFAATASRTRRSDTWSSRLSDANRSCMQHQIGSNKLE